MAPQSLGVPCAIDAASHAAGILFVAPDGDVLLLRRATGETNYGGHWALPGGGAEDDETPEQCAIREATEEMGATLPGQPKLLDSRATPTGMAFHTFAQPAPQKFAPRLNEEHSGFAWAPLNMLPQPVHPGVAATIADRLHADRAAADMTPEDWTGLTDGFLKWLAKEEAVPQHAADYKWGPKVGDVIEFTDDHFTDKGPASATVLNVDGPTIGVDWGTADAPEPASFNWRDLIEAAVRSDVDGKSWWKIDPREMASDRMAIDRASVRRIDQDGHLHVTLTNISKATVNPYYGSEIPDAERMGLDPTKIYALLRDPEELAKAAPTFAGKPLLDLHKPQTAETHDKDLVVGTVGTEVVFEAPYLMAPLTVWDGESIGRIESDKQRELSCGYRYRADMTPGVYQGTPYDGVMRDIVGNHVALVAEGRAGPDVVVGDSKLNSGDHTMAKVALTRQALLASGALLAYIAPKLAADGAKINMTALVKDVSRKTWKADKVRLAADLKAATKGKLAKDADLEDVVALLDKLDGDEPDAPVLDDEPMVDPDMSVDADREEIKAMLEAKGCTPEEIAKVMALGAVAGQDDPPDFTGKPKVSGKDAKQDDKDDDKVSKPAMDAAIAGAVKAAVKTAEDATMKRLEAIRIAERAVAPLIGTVTTAMDSAEKIYAAALKHHGEDVTGLDANAMARMVGLLVKQKGAAHRPAATPQAADSTALAAFQKQHGIEARSIRVLG